MKSEVISFFYDFNCIADKCRDNCCRSWNLIVDEETVKKYKKIPGKRGFFYRLSIRKSPGGGYVLRAPFSRCVHQDKCGLCRLQCNGEEECLPKVCRLFPRYTVSYGGYEIGVIDLACEEAAGLFLKQTGRIGFIDSRATLDIYWKIDEADRDFASVLRKDLDLILDHIYSGDGKNLWELQKDVFAHIYAEHLLLVRNELKNPEDTGFDRETLVNEHYGELTWILQERFKSLYNGLPVIPFSFVNEFVYREFSDLYLLLYHPKAFKLFWKYKRYFGKIRESEADKIFTDRLKELFVRYDWLEEKLTNYYAYKLQTFYLGASVDYYLIEPVSLAAFCCEFLVLLLLTYTYRKDAEFDMDVFARLISENDRLISHNVSFRERIMKRMREKLF